MKRRTLLSLFSLSIALLTATPACTQIAASNEPVVFVATTPCSAGTRPLPGMAHEAECDLIHWNLKLFQNKVKQTSGTYILDCDYGSPQQGTKNLIHGGKHVHREGKWVMVKSSRTNSAAIVYRLDPDKPKESISFLSLNENVIHLLDNRQQLMIGNGGASYTLNKLKQ